MTRKSRWLLILLGVLPGLFLRAGESVELLGRRFDSAEEGGLRKLRNYAVEQIRRYESQDDAHDRLRDELRSRGELRELPEPLLWEYFHPPADDLIKRDRRGLREIVDRCDAILAAPVGERERARRELAELAAAVDNNHRPLVEPVEALFAPVLFWQSLRNGIGGGGRPAAHVAADEDGLPDPPASSFWTRPEDIAAANLHAGFGRRRLPDYTATVWEYDEPKTSSGANPGFDVEHGDDELEVKLFEAYSDPFAARIFHALGYHVNVTDHSPALRVRYDRRLLREFNLRAPIHLRIRLLGIPHYRQNLQEYRDPFHYLRAVRLIDGVLLSAAEFKARLFVDASRARPERDPANFDAAFETRIDWLEFGPADVQPDDSAIDSIGPWDYAGLGHEDRREVRGMGVIAGWLGYWDARWNNTRLKRVETREGREGREGRELRHFISDLGGGLGRAEPYYGWGPERPNAFTWFFTEPPIVRGPGRMTTPFRFAHFHTSRDNRAYQAMTEADARWGARLLGHLTEAQIAAALIASGHDSAPAKLYLEKLVARRDRLMIDLGLADEVGLLRETPPDRLFNYDPRRDGPFTARLPDGEVITAPAGRRVVVEGVLVKREE